ncbi:putative RING-H2 finger protein ATL58-like [Scophthalmus maximus]|uniref:Putative RING-H2 finger protein ATL58-like n=1 Tax=Scophthalmus maximus TaxID=52904 RepID=A0A2U9C5J7_SCOMX|nr:putative RING-H2 finger protein ATL58-like [Scophthalmus maximus]
MVLCEDGECSVCLLPFSRMDRVPRVLHCRHTFCEPCLGTMSQARGGLLTVGCPLCRRVTCIGRGLSLQEALWVNSKLWEQIPEDVDEDEEEEEEEEEDVQLKREAEGERIEAKQQPSLQAEWWRFLELGESEAEATRFLQKVQSDQAAPGEDRARQQRGLDEKEEMC